MLRNFQFYPENIWWFKWNGKYSSLWCSGLNNTKQLKSCVAERIWLGCSQPHCMLCVPERICFWKYPKNISGLSSINEPAWLTAKVCQVKNLVSTSFHGVCIPSCRETSPFLYNFLGHKIHRMFSIWLLTKQLSLKANLFSQHCYFTLSVWIKLLFSYTKCGSNAHQNTQGTLTRSVVAHFPKKSPLLFVFWGRAVALPIHVWRFTEPVSCLKSCWMLINIGCLFSSHYSWLMASIWSTFALMLTCWQAALCILYWLRIPALCRCSIIHLMSEVFKLW